MSTGAKDDLKKVTDIANQMVCEYGMSKLGFMTIEGNSKSFMSDKVQKEANSIVENCYKETLKLINENINDLHRWILIWLTKLNIESFMSVL